MCFSVVIVFSCGKRTNKKRTLSRVQKFNQGCLLFFEEGRRKNIFLNLSWIHKSLLRA